MGNRMFQQWHLNQVFLGVLNSFGNGVRYFIRFAQAIANYTVSITDNNNSRKAKATPTFYYFSNAVNCNNALLQL